MKLKKVIIILCVILVVLISIIVISMLYSNNSEQELPIIEIDEGQIDTKIKKVSERNSFYAVQSCVNKFYIYYAALYNDSNNSYILDEEAEANIKEKKQENVNAIYNILDPEYINFRGLTEDNLLDKLEKINESNVNITNMYVSQKTDHMYIYIVKGALREKTTGKISDFQVMIKSDSSNRTFTIYLQDYITAKYPNLVLGEDIDIAISENIEKNTYNMYDYKYISDEIYITDLFSKYKEEVLYNSNLAYQHLNEEYRNKRFGSSEEFKEYAKNNIKKHVIMQVTQYQKIEADDNNTTRYIAVDQNGNYYIFNEEAVMDYTLVLDTYTIDLPEFLDKYKSAKEEEKILYNIQKVFEAINSGDYKYVYNKLDNDFKTNYFKTESDFENYIKEHLYINNKVGYEDYQKTGEIYTYTIQITNKDNASSKTINQKIVMKLKEGTDFVMSFSME